MPSTNMTTSMESSSKTMFEHTAPVTAGGAAFHWRGLFGSAARA